MPRRFNIASDPLTPKQEAFCCAYIETGVGAQAYRIGFKRPELWPTAAMKRAQDLLRKPNVARRIEELREEHRKRHEVTVDRVIMELGKIAFTDLREVLDWGDAIPVTDPETGEVKIANGIKLMSAKDISSKAHAAIAEIKQTKDGFSVKMHSKDGALEKLGRVLGAFKDRVEHTGKDGKDLVPEREMSDLDLARWMAHVMEKGARQAEEERLLQLTAQEDDPDGK